MPIDPTIFDPTLTADEAARFRAKSMSSLPSVPSFRPERSALGAGWDAGVHNTLSLAAGFTAMIGDTLGIDALQQWGLRHAESQQHESAMAGIDKKTSLEAIEGQGIAGFMEYAMYTLGQAGPTLLETIAAALAGGGVGGIVGKAAAKKKIKDLVAKGMKNSLDPKDAAELSDILVTTSRKWATRGRRAGGLTAGYQIGTGDVYLETKDAPTALIAGVPYALAEYAPAAVAIGLGKAGLKKSIVSNLSPVTAKGKAAKVAFEAGKGAIKVGTGESLAEFIQEGVVISSALANDQDPGNIESRLKNAAAAGFIGGTAPGAAGGFLGALRQPPPTEQQVQDRAAADVQKLLAEIDNPSQLADIQSQPPGGTTNGLQEEQGRQVLHDRSLHQGQLDGRQGEGRQEPLLQPEEPAGDSSLNAPSQPPTPASLPGEEAPPVPNRGSGPLDAYIAGDIDIDEAISRYTSPDSNTAADRDDAADPTAFGLEGSPGRPLPPVVERLGGRADGDYYAVDPKKIEVDPERFQYKVMRGKGGATGSISGVKVWNPDLAGQIAVWEDPDDGKVYVVNGHNRLAKANELDVDEIQIKLINAKDAREARKIGAQMNIGEGKGSIIDAAEFIRSSDTDDLSTLVGYGVNPEGHDITIATGLANLHPALWSMVRRGDRTLGQERAAMIGHRIEDENKQLQFVNDILSRSGSLVNSEVSEMIDLFLNPQGFIEQGDGGGSLFDGTESEGLFSDAAISTMVEQAKVINSVAQRLRDDKRVFGNVSKNAQKISQADIGDLDAAEAAKLSEGAARALSVLDSLKNNVLRPAIMAAAAEVANGTPLKKATDDVYPKILDAINATLRGESPVSQPQQQAAGQSGDGTGGSPDLFGTDIPGETTPELPLESGSFDSIENHPLYDSAQLHVHDMNEFGMMAKPEKVNNARNRKNQPEFLTPEEAAAKVQSWKDQAAEDGRNNHGRGRIVLSLFDVSGVMSQPWRDAGYDVRQFDIDENSGGGNNLAENVDIMEMARQYMEDSGIEDVAVVLAQPPCTHFACSGARWFKEKDLDGRTKSMIDLAQHTFDLIGWLRPEAWMLENPKGRIKTLLGLPDPSLKFDPYNYGDPYTKETHIWGNFNVDLPYANVEPTQGSRMHKMGSSQQYERSVTPEGFAYAFYMANRNHRDRFHDKVAAAIEKIEDGTLPTDYPPRQREPKGVATDEESLVGKEAPIGENMLHGNLYERDGRRYYIKDGKKVFEPAGEERPREFWTSEETLAHVHSQLNADPNENRAKRYWPFEVAQQFAEEVLSADLPASLYAESLRNKAKEIQSAIAAIRSGKRYSEKRVRRISTLVALAGAVINNAQRASKPLGIELPPHLMDLDPKAESQRINPDMVYPQEKVRDPAAPKPSKDRVMGGLFVDPDDKEALRAHIGDLDILRRRVREESIRQKLNDGYNNLEETKKYLRERGLPPIADMATKEEKSFHLNELQRLRNERRAQIEKDTKPLTDEELLASEAQVLKDIYRNSQETPAALSNVRNAVLRGIDIDPDIVVRAQELRPSLFDNPRIPRRLGAAKLGIEIGASKWRRKKNVHSFTKTVGRYTVEGKGRGTSRPKQGEAIFSLKGPDGSIVAEKLTAKQAENLALEKIAENQGYPTPTREEVKSRAAAAKKLYADRHGAPAPTPPPTPAKKPPKKAKTPAPAGAADKMAEIMAQLGHKKTVDVDEDAQGRFSLTPAERANVTTAAFELVGMFIDAGITDPNEFAASLHEMVMGYNPDGWADLARFARHGWNTYAEENAEINELTGKEWASIIEPLQEALNDPTATETPAGDNADNRAGSANAGSGRGSARGQRSPSRGEGAQRGVASKGPESREDGNDVKGTPTAPLDSPSGEPGAGRGRGSEAGSSSVIPELVESRPSPPPVKDNVPWRLLDHLYESQVKAINLAIAAMDRAGGFLIADGTGAGKTREILGVADYYANEGKKVLIVTPTSIINPRWPEGRFFGSYDGDSKDMGISLQLYKGDQNSPQMRGGNIYLTTDMRLGDITVDSDTVLILDESHLMAKNAQQAAEALESRRQAGDNRPPPRSHLAYQKIMSADKVLYATATFGDKPTHLRYLERAGILEGVDADTQYESLGYRRQDITRKEKDENGKEIEVVVGKTYVLNVTPKEYNRRVGQLFDRMTADGQMIKRDLSFVAKNGQRVEFSVTNITEVDMPGISAMKKAIQPASTRTREGTEKFHQESLKVGVLAQMAREELNEGRQVIMYLTRANKPVTTWYKKDRYGEFITEEEHNDPNHSRFWKELFTSQATAPLLIDEMVNRYNMDISEIGQINGEMTKKEKQEVIAKFQSGEIKMVLTTTGSAGTGLNLDDVVGDKPRTVIFGSLPDQGTSYVQSIGRVWRQTTRSIPRIRHLLVENQVGDKEKAVLGRKLRQLMATLGGELRDFDIAGLATGIATDPEPVTKLARRKFLNPQTGKQSLTSIEEFVDDGLTAIRFDAPPHAAIKPAIKNAGYEYDNDFKGYIKHGATLKETQEFLDRLSKSVYAPWRERIRKTRGVAYFDIAEQLPAKVKEYAAKKSIPLSRVAGFHSPSFNQVIVLGQNIRDEAHAAEVVIHELVGHKGIGYVLGDRLPSVARQIFDSVPMAELQPLIDRYFAGSRKFNPEFARHREEIAEEYIAHMAPRIAGDPPAWWEGVVSGIRDFLRNMGFNVKWSTQDIRVLISQAQEAPDGPPALSDQTVNPKGRFSLTGLLDPLPPQMPIAHIREMQRREKTHGIDANAPIQIRQAQVNDKLASRIHHSTRSSLTKLADLYNQWRDFNEDSTGYVPRPYRFSLNDASDYYDAQWDAEYLAEAKKHEAGKPNKAAQMVDKAAFSEGYGEGPVLHGTTHKFTAFKMDRVNPDNDFGNGFYFTNNRGDVTANYAGVGPDLTQRIDERVESLRRSPSHTVDSATKQAREELVGTTERVISAFINMDNPAIIGEDSNGAEMRLDMDQFFYDEDAMADYEDEAWAEVRQENDLDDDADKADWEFAIREKQEEWAEDNGYYNEDPHPLVKAVQEVLANDDIENYGESDLSEINNFLFDNPTMAEVEDALRNVFELATHSDTGKPIVGEAVRRVFEKLGHDGIVDFRVSEKFRGMHLSPDTYHLIAFKPNQIKSSDPVTYDDDGNIIPISKRFDPTTNDYRFSLNKASELSEKIRTGKDRFDENFFEVFWPKVLREVGQNLKPSTRNINRATSTALDDIIGWIKENPIYADYYKNDWKLTREYLDAAFGGITDSDLRLFRFIAGVTSPSTKLADNLIDTLNAFQLWREGRGFSDIKMGKSAKGKRIVAKSPFTFRSTTGAAKAHALKIIDELIQEKGIMEAIAYMEEPAPIADLNALNARFGKGKVGKVGAIRRVVKEATGQDRLIPRMFIFGPKVGAYTMNTLGHSEFTTTDIWEARFIRSYFPKMFESSTGLPINDQEHEIFQRFASSFNAKLEAKLGHSIEPSAGQAMRWFYMLEMARKAGYRNARTDSPISEYARQAINHVFGRTVIPDPDSGRRSDAGSSAGRFSLTEPEGYTGNRSDLEAALGNIGQQPREKGSLGEQIQKWGYRFVQGVFDRYFSLFKMEKALAGGWDKTLDKQDNSWTDAQMSNFGARALTAIFRHGDIRLVGKQNTPDFVNPEGVKNGTEIGLDQYFRENLKGAEFQRFWHWMVGKRAQFLMADGREKLFDQPKIDALLALSDGTMEDGKSRLKHYERVAARVDKTRRAVVSMAVKAGVISGRNRHEWDQQFYVPFFRMKGHEDHFLSGSRELDQLVKQKGIKRLLGGKDNIGDPFTNYILNLAHLTSASMRNLAAKKALNNAVRLKIAKKLTTHKKFKPGPGDTWHLEDGKKVWFRISQDTHDINGVTVDGRLVLKSMEALEYDAGFKNPVIKAATKFKRLLTLGVTTNPAFQIRNLMRDSLHSAAVADTSTNILDNVYQGMKNADSLLSARLALTGGTFEFGHIFSGDKRGASERVARKISGIDISKEEGLKKLVAAGELVEEKVGALFKRYGDLTNKAENVNRIAAAAHILVREGGDVDAAWEKAGKRASFEAQDTLNFEGHGAWQTVRLMGQIMPFFNARLQGMYKLYRSGNDPNQRKQFFQVLGTYTLATTALYLLNRDDEEYRELEDWERDSYHHLFINGQQFRLPRPFELAIPVTVIERMIDTFPGGSTDRKTFFSRMYHLVADQLNLISMPQIIAPLYEIGKNVDGFTGRQIEGMSMRRLMPMDRVKHDTAYPAVLLAQLSQWAPTPSHLKMSPIQVDHLVNAYFGWLGAFTMTVGDKMWRLTTNQDVFPNGVGIRDMIGLNAISRGDDPPSHTRYMTVFYDQAQEVSEIYATIQHKLRLGQIEEAHELAVKHGDKLKVRLQVNRAKRQLSELNQQIKRIQSNKTMSPSQRRELINSINRLKNDFARQTLMKLNEEK